jgi:hypothetical protein
MLDGFVRSVNARLPPPGVSGLVLGEGKRNSLIAETAYRLVAASVTGATVVKEVEEAVATAAHKRVAMLERVAAEAIVPLSIAELALARRLAEWLRNYFAANHSGEALFLPVGIRGCGVINAAEADALAGETLYELKSVDRGFRGTDFRQVLVYAALNHASQQYPVTRIAVLNPRAGYAYPISIDAFARLTAGTSGGELLSELVEDMNRSGSSQ